MSSLPDEYFGGGRQSRLDALNEKFDQLFLVKRDVQVRIPNNKVDLPDSVCDSIRNRYGEGYLAPFLGGVKDKKMEKGNVIVYSELAGTDMKYENKQIVQISRANLLTVVATEIIGYEYNENFGAVKFDVPLPPSYGRLVDGQLKITVDTVLAIDDAIWSNQEVNKRDLKILVIGSSSPNGLRSGQSYSIIPYMCSGIVHLFDPFEPSRVFFEDGPYGRVHYRGITDKFYYSKKKILEYDLVLDDSWEYGRSRDDRDLGDLVTCCKNFSLKCFPWEADFSENKDRKGNIYYQKFYTESKEMRRVSRDPKALGHMCNFDLGRCVACNELQYRLKMNYTSEFYLKFLELHKINCVTKKHLEKLMIEESVDWIPINECDISLSEYYCLQFDPLVDARVCNVGVMGIENMKFVFSKKENVPARILHDSYQVMIFHPGESYVNKLCGLERKTLVPEYVAAKHANLTHSNESVKKRKVTYKRRHK